MPFFISGWASAPTIDRVGHKTLARGLVIHPALGTGASRALKMLWTHDRHVVPVGIWIKAEPRLWGSGQYGLWVEGIVVDTEAGRDLQKLLAVQLLSFSVGMFLDTVSVEPWPGDPNREYLVIEKAELEEVSIVVEPACYEAVMTSARAITDKEMAKLLGRDLESAVKEFSKFTRELTGTASTLTPTEQRLADQLKAFKGILA
ncbi:prohead serine protease [Pseudosulfitobacter pseudonitzschiae]|uniref:Prohead serine protease domain-containing protein n=1 Tax=Pseudosulfitobacter pseudonitzschiae TaxID=1402135 RepID=A0A073J9A8_9RHOB|nr:HK97 family phage prohead protease [Pseudosulfitobacter pseudonitzschiae]KEJ98276.1 hypothetical protein SUH3_04590 [Pseudosulfitobacter pseudonitzschiae]SHE40301.1 prohead serine protease [Pseudosulfitobacter pseudonitzschiae]